MIGSFLTRGLVMVFGYAYPAYECYKTVELNKPEIEQLRFWCQYWILVAVLTVCERIGDTFISWVPMYSEAKLAFYIYLWYPKTKGTSYVYDSFFKPYVAKHENEIDRSLLELRTRAGDMVFVYWQRAASYGQTRVFEIQMVTRHHDQLKASNSWWKARKQELTMGVIKREDQLNLLRMDSGQETVKCPDHAVDDQAHLSLRMPGITVHQQQPFMLDKNADYQEMGCNYPNPCDQRRVSLFPSTNSSASDDFGPRSIPDLNLTIGQPAWMDSDVKQLVDDKSTVVNGATVGSVVSRAITVGSINKAIAAQARRRRMLICKNKLSNVSSKLRFPL